MNENPINPDKVAENPGLLPYAHNAGSAIIKPEDLGKIKGKSILAMRQQTDKQMGQLAEQMQTLLKQANEIKQRVSLSERIYDANIGFEPIIGHNYYVYERENGQDLISLVAPHEWGRSFKYSRYIGKVYLLADHTWEVLEVGEVDF
jgi:Protein of unknown function (DUF2452)